MDRYIGLDAHSSSCTVGVVGPSGKLLQRQVLETNARVLIDFIRTIPGNRHLCLEEGTHSNWLYEILSPHVQEIVVMGVWKTWGPKNDKIDALEELRKSAEKAMLQEARKHTIYRLLTTVPGLGKIRAAQLLPIVVTPYRFASKRSFWAYCGLAIVMRSSADWVRTRDGRWVKTKIQQTRGLNRNYNHILKQIFKGAASTVIGRANDEPLHNHYQHLLDSGTKPNLARLTIARQIASIVLSIWRSQEVYDPKKVSQAA